MEARKLHIVSFDVPLPADYGGAIDVFYRVKALHSMGVKVTLHCFEYGRGQSKELENYADKVIYYKRKRKLIDVMNRLPFIVKTRVSKALLSNLLADDAPILFEGLHTTFCLNDERLRSRNKMVRMHNIEHDYYDGLARQSHGFRKRYYLTEAKKLKAYEQQLKHANALFAIKEEDAKHLRKYRPDNTFLVPACADVSTNYSGETDAFCLFQGNLSVPENDHGLVWLIEKVFAPSNLTNKLKVAGKEPSDALVALCNSSGIQLISNPDVQEMKSLTDQARVHVFYSDQDTGVKLKLINAIRTSGAIITNSKMLSEGDLKTICETVETPEDYLEKILYFLDNTISPDELKLRQSYIDQNLDPSKNCQIIIDQL